MSGELFKRLLYPQQNDFEQSRFGGDVGVGIQNQHLGFGLGLLEAFEGCLLHSEGVLVSVLV